MIAAAAAATILFSFSAQWFILTRLGAHRTTDAYFAALAVPVVILYIVGDPLSRVSVPLLSVKSEDEYWPWGWALLIMACAAFFVVAIILWVSVPFWVHYLVPGFSDESARLTARLMRILLIGMLLQGVSIASRALWNARNHFVWPSAASAIAAFSSLVFLFMTLERYGIQMAAWAFDVRFGVECLLLIGLLRRYQRPQWSAMPVVLRSARPLVLGAAYFRTDVVVDRVLTSLAAPGSLSLYYLAQQLLSAMGQVINQSVVAPKIPGLARTAHSSKWDLFGRDIRSTATALLFLAAGIIVTILLFGKPGLSLVFAHQSLGPAEIKRLSLLVLALSGMLLSDGIIYFAYSAFYSANDTTTPTVATALVYSVGIAAKIGAFLVAGVTGLAIAVSVYYATNALVLLLLLRTKIKRLRETAFQLPPDADTGLSALPTQPVAEPF